ncbi:MAG TPA: hypothetical protein VLQ45_17760 [Thermoanaerobaculia bacterium]|nr:hypothetical protein [Thermoanaerobaculia bacterium]
MRVIRKLSLNKETLGRLDLRKRSDDALVGDPSCVESCYFVSCDGGCGISTGLKDD